MVICPVCRESESTQLCVLQTQDFETSPLYRCVRIYSCVACGHVFNLLAGPDKDGVVRYYAEESSRVNVAGPVLNSDLPGSDNELSVRRYQQVLAFVSPYLQREQRVIDVGCGMGGFVRHLVKAGYRATGYDFVPRYIDYARRTGVGEYVLANGESLGLESRSVDVLVLDHVLEHVFDPIAFLREAHRVLADDGVLYIGVPDAGRYRAHPFFSFFWFLLREHIHHFDLNNLATLVECEGFKIIAHEATTSPMMSEKMILPNLLCLFRKRGDRRGERGEVKDLGREMVKYVDAETRSLTDLEGRLSAELRGADVVYLWGIGKESMFLLDRPLFAGRKGLRLLDGNREKHGHVIAGMTVMDSSSITGAPADAVLVVTARAHGEPIKHAAQGLGFRGKIVIV